MYQNAQTAIPTPPINRVGRAYGQVIRQTDTPRDLERRVFQQITAALEAITPDSTHEARIDAVSRNRELWNVLTWSVVDDQNALPTGLRAIIAKLGRWVDAECGRALRSNIPLNTMIEINHSIINGLTTSVETTPCP